MTDQNLQIIIEANDKASQKMDGLAGKIDGVKSAVSGFGNVASVAFGGLITNAIGGVVNEVKNLTTSQISAVENLEMTRTAFNTIIGDATKTGKLMKEISTMASDTPFELRELQNASKQLLGFDIEADKVIPTLTMIGDVASGINAPIGDLAYLFGTVKTQGRAMTGDLNQFASRGIPIFDELSKVMGVNADQVRDLASQGKIGFPEIEKAFGNMTKEGGKFSGMMKNQSNTIVGLKSTLKDTMSTAINSIIGINQEGEIRAGSFLDKMKDKIQGLLSWLNANGESISNFVGGALDKLLDGITGVVEIGKLLFSGDFQGGIFGLGEDDPIIGLLLSLRSNIIFLAQNIMPILSQAFNLYLTQYLIPLSLKLSEFATWFMTTLYPIITQFVSVVWTSLEQAFNTFTTVILPQIMPALQFLAVQFQILWQDVVRFTNDSLLPMIKAMMDLWQVVSPFVIPILVVLASIVVGVLYVALVAIITIIRGVIAVLEDMANQFRNKINRGIEAINDLKRVWQDVVGFFQKINLFNIGSNIIQSLVNGIGSGISGLKNKVQEVANMLPTEVRQLLGIRSPSRVFHEIGVNTVQGLTQGIESEMPNIYQSSQNMAQTPIDATKSNSINSINESNSNQKVVINIDARGALLDNKSLETWLYQTKNVFGRVGFEILK